MRFIALVGVVLGLVVLAVVPGGQITEAAQGVPQGQVRLVESNAKHVLLEITTPSLSIQEQNVNGTTYAELTAAGWVRSSEPGKPRVPMFGTLLAVPQGANLSVRIAQDQTRQETLAHPILPNPQAEAVGGSLTELPEGLRLEYVPDPATYESSALYPQDIVSTTPPANWRSQRYIRLQVFPFQYNPATRQLLVHERLRIEVKFGLAAGATAEQLGTSVAEGSFEPILKAGLLNYDSARAWRAPVRRTVNAPHAEAAAASTDAYRIAVNADGIYKVTCTELQGVVSKLNAVDLNTLHLSFMGAEVAIDLIDKNGDKRCGSNDYFLFFGQAPTDPIVPANIYWLTFGGSNGKRMLMPPAVNGATPQSYLKTLHLQENSGINPYVPWSETVSHWFWLPVNLGPGYTDVSPSLDDLAPGSSSGTLRAFLMSGGPGHPSAPLDAQLYSNGVQVAAKAWSLGETLLATADVTNLVQGSNVFRVQDTLYGTIPGFVLLKYLELDYQALFKASGDVLRFRYANAGTWTYQVSGFTSSNVLAFDITDPHNVVRLAVNSSSNSAVFGDTVTTPKEYLVLSSARFLKPDSIEQDTPSDLRNPNNGADYIIITYGDWKKKVQPLVSLRATLGRVKVVDVQDIYDEFNYGIFSAQAIHDFLEWTYTHWQQPKPSYVLLVGNGNYNKVGGEPSFIPVYMTLADPWIGLVPSDSRFVMLDPNSELPSMAIGRLPALNGADVDAMIDKLLDYENIAPEGEWRNTVMFVSDDAYQAPGVLDPAGNFFAFSEEVAGDANYLPSAMQADRVYYDPCGNCGPPFGLPSDSFYATVSAAHDAILQGINSGRLIVNYVGHGEIPGWAHQMFRRNDVASLTRADGDPKYPFMMPMTCLEGAFQGGADTSFAEALLKLPKGGAIGTWAPSGLGVANGHDFLDRGFFRALFLGGQVRIGLATTASKAFLIANSMGSHYDLLDSYNLLGDPGMLVSLPTEIAPTPTPTPTRTPTVTPTPTLTPKPDAEPTPAGCAKKPPRPLPVAPASGKAIGKKRVLLKWQGNNCATTYRVVVRIGNAKGKLVDQATLTGTQHRTKALAPNLKYVWRVTACNDKGCKSSLWQPFTRK